MISSSVPLVLSGPNESIRKYWLIPMTVFLSITVAAFLSHLVFQDKVPRAWAPDAETRALRKYGRQWHNVSRSHAKAVIQADWIFKQHNLNGPGKIEGASLQRWLMGQGHRLAPHARVILIQMLQTMEHFEHQQVELRRELIAMSRSERFKHDIVRLQTIPGIAEILAPIIRGEFGDFGRFKSADAAAAFTGLTERTRESAGKVKPGKISKHGSGTLRWALVEAATTLVRSDPKYKAIYKRIEKNTRYKTQAKVAVARKLVRWIWTMFKNDTDFIRGGTTDHVKRANQARLAKKAKPA